MKLIGDLAKADCEWVQLAEFIPDCQRRLYSDPAVCRLFKITRQTLLPVPEITRQSSRLWRLQHVQLLASV